MRIGILGSGLMGGKLGTIFVRAGHQVIFSYARSQKNWRSLRGMRAGTPRRERLRKPHGMRTRFCWPCSGPA